MEPEVQPSYAEPQPHPPPRLSSAIVHAVLMSLRDVFEEDAAWAAAAPVAPGDILRDSMRKEVIVKDIIAAQEDLRVLLARVNTVQGEVDKLTSGNETLQMYVDNLAKQLAASKK